MYLHPGAPARGHRTAYKPPETQAEPLLLLCTCYCHSGLVILCAGHSLTPSLQRPHEAPGTAPGFLSHANKEERQGALHWPQLRTTVLACTREGGTAYAHCTLALQPRTGGEGQEYAFSLTKRSSPVSEPKLRSQRCLPRTWASHNKTKQVSIPSPHHDALLQP